MKTVLFDLDGTIINSKEGITICIRHEPDYFGMEQPLLPGSGGIS